MSHSILLVDDEEGIRKFLGLTLEDMGFAVSTAENGSRALEVFEETGPDIVLTDIKMPVMDGIELLKRIKEKSPATEVIMISGHGDMDLAIESLKHDAADFVTKPINDLILQAALDRVREKLEMRRELARHTEQLEALVEEQTARLRQLFDEAPCFITVQDRDLRMVETNKRFEEAFSRAQGEFCYKAYKHRDEPCDGCPILATFEDGQNHQRETVVTTRDGRPVNVLVWTAPIRDAKGEIVRVMELSTDITQIRQLQDHLTSLGLMLGSMSHGVKGMLTALDGGLYRLQSGIRKGDMDRVTDAAETLDEVTGRIKGLVLDILYYAKSRDLDFEETDVRVFAERVAALVEPRAQKNGVKLEVDLEPVEDLGVMDMDENQLSAALVNFLENGVDACVADLKKKPEHIVRFSVGADGRDLVMEISDNGMGMDRETREKIFTLFFSSKGRKGTGLGLFISNHVVERHGGAITVKSQPGAGTSFVVRLPRKQAPRTTAVECPVSGEEETASDSEQGGDAQ